MELHAPDYIILLIDDLERSLTFYTQVIGLRLGHRSEEYAQLATGPTRLGLYTRRAMAQVVGVPLHPPALDAPGCELGFNPTTPLSLALCLSALTMRKIRLVIAPLDPGHVGEALLNRIRMQG